MAESSKITAKLRAAAEAAGPSSSPIPLISLEFFPPKTNSGLSNLYARILRMVRHLAEHSPSHPQPQNDDKSQDAGDEREGGQLLTPAWVNITWGAGGTTQDRSLGLAARVQNGLLSEGGSGEQHSSEEELDLMLAAATTSAGDGAVGVGGSRMEARDVCLHLTCTNVTRTSLEHTLKKAKEYGIRNILALRGDPPRGSEYWTPADASFQQATDLIRFIREHYQDYFCIGVAGYPESHPDAPSNQDLEANVAQLKSKQDCGADFVVTQLFYDVDVFVRWYRRCREVGITIPIIPGIMPIQNYQSFKRMANLCKAKIPPKILTDLEPIKSDDAAIKQYGIKLSVDTVLEVKRQIPEMAAFHFCTVNLEKSILAIVDQLGWVGVHRHEQDAQEHNRIISDKSGTATPSDLKISSRAAVANVISARSHLDNGTTPSLDADSLRKAALLSSTQASSVSHAQGVTGPSEGGVGSASWDEFPNGRYGDSRSPAYGEMDGYGVSLKVPPAEALKLWGTPTSHADISTMFASYLLGQTPAMPWCDLPLFNETMAIRNYLLALNLSQPKGDERDKTLQVLESSASEEDRVLGSRIRARSDVVCKGWWTVGSQPAVGGISSGDPTYGFGPQDGYVFQKAFVEFFVEERCKKWLLEKIEKEGNGKVTFFAGNAKGDFETNVEPGGVNAVTWAVFPGKEIVQSTIIEEESFKAWRDEAFEIWGEWACLYPPKSASRKLLESVRDSRWLVTVVHHDFKDEKALWKFLGCAVIDDAESVPASKNSSKKDEAASGAGAAASEKKKEAKTGASDKKTEADADASGSAGSEPVELKADAELVGFIKSRIGGVKERIEKAHRYAKEHGSKAKAPRLVAVSKLQTPTSILAAHKGAGQVHFGENYVQEMIDKAKVLPQEIKWHFVGGLQSNKAKLLAGMPNLYLLETLDSVKAANALERALSADGAPKRAEPLRVYIQVNTSREDAKSGVMPFHSEKDSTPDAKEEPLFQLAAHVISKCPSIILAGLMTIGSASNSKAAKQDVTTLPPSEALHLNPDFDTLLENRTRLVAALRDGSTNDELRSDKTVQSRYPALFGSASDAAGDDETGGLELSMGMSADVEVATVAGSNNVRVGTDCFSQRPGTRDEAMERMKGELENGVRWVE